MIRNRNIKKIILIALGIGILLSLAGFVILKQTIDYTNQTEYCLSCHEPLKAGYLASSHGQNKTGIQVDCIECHAPLASNDIETLSHKFLALKRPVMKLFGALSTEDKFNQKKLVMAKNVWRWMKANPSEGCNSCHDFANMDLTKQETRAQQQHLIAEQKGESCITCHIGIVHRLMEGGKKEHEAIFRKD